MSEKTLVGFEGKESVDGRYLEPGALALPIGPIPVTCAFDHALVGKAIGFERRDDGGIYADIQIEPDCVVPEPWTPSLSVDEVQASTDVPDKFHVHSARIRSVHLLDGPNSMWPEVNRA